MGYARNIYRDYLIDPPNPPPLDLILALRNRDEIDDAEADKMLRALGYGLPIDREMIRVLRHSIPGTSDLISFAVREVWDTNVVQRFDYDLEFPPQFQQWMNYQGIGWKPSDLGYQVPGGQDIPWPLAYWRAHWQVMSPTQASEALYRLRPRTPASNQSRIDGVRAFRPDDFDQLLKVADYPPIIREWLKGLAYQPLTRVDIRRAYQVGSMDAQEVKESLMDIGYTEDNAERLRDFFTVLKERENFGKSLTRLRSAVLAAYKAGTIERNNAAEQLYRASRKTLTLLQQYDAKTLAERRQIALADPDTQTELSALEAQRVAAQAVRVTKRVQRAYLHGVLTETDVHNILGQAGVYVDRVNQLLDEWRLDLVTGRKEITASTLTKWFVRGVIGAGDLFARLVNLGYTTQDANIMVRLSQQDASTALAKAAEKAAQTDNQRRKALAAQIKAAQADAESAQKRLLRQASKADILKFLKLGLINTDQAMAALLDRGYTADVAALNVATVTTVEQPPEGESDETEEEDAGGEPSEDE